MRAPMTARMSRPGAPAGSGKPVERRRCLTCRVTQWIAADPSDTVLFGSPWREKPHRQALAQHVVAIGEGGGENKGVVEIDVRLEALATASADLRAVQIGQRGGFQIRRYDGNDENE